MEAKYHLQFWVSSKEKEAQEADGRSYKEIFLAGLGQPGQVLNKVRADKPIKIGKAHPGEYTGGLYGCGCNKQEGQTLCTKHQRL